MYDELDALCQFYTDQYGMRIHIVYDPVSFVMEGYIVFQNTRKNYTIKYAGMTGKEIAQHLHLIIYDVLAEDANKVLNRRVVNG